MKKLALILAASWLVTVSEVKAGELDSEYVGKANVEATTTSSLAQPPTEMDVEVPAQAWFHGQRFFGYRYPTFGYYRSFYGYPGFAYGGFGYGWFGRGFGFGRRW